MAWQFVFRDTYLFDATGSNVRIPMLFHPGFRIAINAKLLTGLGENVRSLGLVYQSLFIDGLGDVRGDSFALAPFFQLLVPKNEFNFRLVYQPVRKQFSVELSIWVDTLPMVIGSSGESVDNTAALGAIQTELAALTTAQSGFSDQMTTLGLGQASIASHQAVTENQLTAVQQGQQAIASQMATVREQLLAIQSSEATEQPALIALNAKQEVLGSQLLAVQQQQSAIATSVEAILTIVTPPAPTPTPAPTPKPSTTPYVATYSSAFAGYEPTYAKLTDGNYTGGNLTNYGNSWIKASFPAAIAVAAINVGGGRDPNNGDLRLTGIQLQYSLNDVDWVMLTTITGNYSSGNVVFSYQLDAPITAQYWRLYKAADYVWVSEFTFQP